MKYLLTANTLMLRAAKPTVARFCVENNIDTNVSMVLVPPQRSYLSGRRCAKIYSKTKKAADSTMDHGVPSPEIRVQEAAAPRRMDDAVCSFISVGDYMSS